MILQGRLLIDPDRTPEPGWLAVEGDRIVEIEHGAVPPERAAAGDEKSIICPAFVDAHLHLPQIDSIGCDGLDLLDWLDRVVYPAESTWRDAAVVERQLAAAYERLLRAGTMVFAGYLTSHFEGAVGFLRAGQRLPLRAIAGQSLMDRRGPSDLLGQRRARLAASERGRAILSVNPRFAVACSDGLLAEAGAAAIDRTLVQTHLAESAGECALVAELFPDDPHYTAVYDRHGLLHERTLLAHALHLCPDEWTLIAERRSVVVHCPGANTFLRSGVFDLDAANEHGVRLGLGSDVAAGPDLAMPRVGRAMIDTAKMRSMTIAPGARIPTPAEVWRLITRGNADALGMDDAGRLELGASADVLVLRTGLAVDEFLVGRLLYTWRDDYIVDRVLAGRLVGRPRGVGAADTLPR